MREDGIFVRRSYREAADAGILLWRENFSLFLLFFGIPLWVCAFSLRLFLPDGYQYYSWLVIWLFKPLFDRIALHIVSVRFFNRDADKKLLIRGLWKTLLRGLAGDLLWRRFSPLRSAMMPVRVLERNIKQGKSLKERKIILKNGGIDYCFILTIWGIAVEAALLLGGSAFLFTLNELMFNGIFIPESFADIEIYLFAAWCLNLILTETIYVCMGFSLYINSRIEVEGWDLEIKFRNFAEKLKNKNIITVLCLACILIPAQSHADDHFTADDDTPFSALQIILESADFGGEKDSWSIRFKNPAQERDIPEFDREYTQRLREILALFLRFIIITVIAGLLAFIIFYFIKYKKKIFFKTKNSYGRTTGINLKDSQNPSLLLEKALNYNEQGETRLAWGCCAAAAIWSLPAYHGINFPPNATENDCVNIINAMTANNPQALLFGRLIKYWVYFAYAGQLPPEGSFEEAVGLCRSMACAGWLNNG
ncbi:MAG: hypothetical protein FWD40_03195 [Treponema sp.]|nr:hypothetical protein [Treponema sp.]